MSWFPFESEVQALQGIYEQILNFPEMLQNVALGVVYTAIYPLVLGLEYFIFDVNYIWFILATFLNAVIAVPNFFISIFNVLMPTHIPVPLMALLYVQIMIQVFIRSIGWIRFIWKNIPIIGGH